MNQSSEIGMSPELRRICDLASAMVARVKTDLEGRRADTLAKNATLYWFAKGAKTYEAILNLWELGYWQDAAMLGRTVLDIFFQIAYLATDPERLATKFWDDPGPRWSKMLKDVIAHGEPDADVRAAFAEFLARKNITEDEIGRVDSWWVDDLAQKTEGNSKRPNRQIRSLAEATGMKRAYVSQYPLLSFLVHSSSPAWRYYLIPKPAGPAVDWGANPPLAELRAEAEMMLSVAPVVLADVINAMSQIWELDYSNELKAFAGVLQEYNTQHI
jgi:hypothetical protein